MQNTNVQREHFPPLPRNTAPMWAGIIAVPAIWIISLQAVYALSPFACVHRQLWLLHLFHIVGLILVALGGVICFRYWRRDGDNQQDRTRFLASYGMLSSSIFFILVLAQTIAGFMLDPCKS